MERDKAGEGKGSGSSTAVNRLYFKGLVSDGGMAGFGVAICDQKDQLLFETKEQVSDAGINRNEIEIRALVRGLSESLGLGLKKLVIYCEDEEIYQIISGKCKPKEEGAIKLMEEVGNLRDKFASTETTLVALNDIKFVFKLAREAIGSQKSDVDDESEEEDGYEDDNPWAYGCGCDWDIDSIRGTDAGTCNANNFYDYDEYVDYWLDQQSRFKAF